jgi:hypothetical protein
MSVTDELCRKASGLHHAREPEPLIEPLPFGHAAPFDPSTFADDSTGKEIVNAFRASCAKVRTVLRVERCSDFLNLEHLVRIQMIPFEGGMHSRASCAKVCAVLRAERCSNFMNLEHLVRLQMIPFEGGML